MSPEADEESPPPEAPEIRAARHRSRALLLTSAVLFLLGVAGLEGLEILQMVKKRDERRRERAAATASASGERAPRGAPSSTR